MLSARPALSCSSLATREARRSVMGGSRAAPSAIACGGRAGGGAGASCG